MTDPDDPILPIIQKLNKNPEPLAASHDDDADADRLNAASADEEGGADGNSRDVGQDVEVPQKVRPEVLSVLTTDQRPLFPGLTVPIGFGGKAVVAAVQRLVKDEGGYCAVALEDSDASEEGSKPVPSPFGSLLHIQRAMPMGGNVIQVLGQSQVRCELLEELKSQGPLRRFRVRYHDDPKQTSPDLRAYMMAIASEVKQVISVNPHFKEQVNLIINDLNYDVPGQTLDILANLLSSDKDVLQGLLETTDIFERAKKVLLLAKQELEVAKLQQSINEQISEKVSKQQREFFLREQLKVIKAELGMDADAPGSEAEMLEDKLADVALSPEVRRVVDQELKKLATLNAQSPEFNVTRSYLELIADLPWGSFSADNTDIKAARRTLDRAHYGLDDVKDAILEFMSTIIRRGHVAGSIICLVGPPGVGKTSIGQSVAEALGRKFYRFSVGGMRDESEIKGHRRTYIGAMPGKLIQALRRAETSNPVVMLDEIDKIGGSHQGDPASALLEVLDPEQNSKFVDHYLDVPFDISNVLFIATANTLDTIPRPLLDRMEVIRLSGYIAQEKYQIARRYLVAKQLRELGFAKGDVKFTRPALLEVIASYAREAGVRSLEKLIRKVLRKLSLKLAEDPAIEVPVTIDKDDIGDYLGKPTFNTEELYNRRVPGVALGLAYTTMGGATLYIEATATESDNAGFRYTGQLGDVMKESAQIAYTFVHSLLTAEGDAFFNSHRVHLHVPAGATPKDGPSAGITMALALYSLAQRKPIRKSLAMTGELTLTGKVLPIGGVREKVIGARRVKVKNLIFPKANERDFEELPDYIKKGVEAHFVDYFSEVLEVAY